jgi:hypothetical protein
MNAPDLEGAAGAVLRQLGVDVVAAGGGRPDLDDEARGRRADVSESSRSSFGITRSTATKKISGM